MTGDKQHSDMPSVSSGRLETNNYHASFEQIITKAFIAASSGLNADRLAKSKQEV